jgi:hypothetical protein
MSSGRRDIRINIGMIPVLRVKMPRASQAVRQPHPSIKTWAMTGKMVRPMPWIIPM